METALILIALAGFFYALVAVRLAEGVITPPMVALALGVGLGLLLPEGQTAGLEPILHVVAELTLVVVLFSDATMIKTKMLRAEVGLPARMLFLGLPLMIGLGFLVNAVLLPDWPFWELCLLAAILAPTDAALGQAVITNKAVPERFREALSVESGLNDGLALPVILFFGCMAVAGIHDNVQTSWVVFTAEQVGLGTLTGIVIGLAGGFLLRLCLTHGLSGGPFEGIAVLALAAMSYFIAVEIGGNGFLAAFVGGLAFGAMFRRQSVFVFEFLETEGQLMVLGTFVLLGIVVVPELAHSVPPVWILLILLSLFVTRPLAIWLSLIGSDTQPGQRVFLGWFGPRGLATALFALLVLQDFDRLTKGHEILLICFLTVLISAVLHGISAAPVAGRFKDPTEKTIQQEGH